MSESAMRRTEERTAPPVATSIQCDVTYLDDWARVTATGWLDVSTIPALRRTVLAAAVLPISGVTLDLSGIEALDRYAVDALVRLREQVRERGAAFALASVSQPVRRAFDVAGVADRFTQESVWSAYPSPEPHL